MKLNFHKKKKKNSANKKKTTKKEHITLQNRWENAEIPFRDISKITIGVVAFCVLSVLALFICGGRFTTAETSDGLKIGFIGFVHDGVPYVGKLHISDSTSAKISGKDGTVTYSDGSVFKGKLENLVPSGEGTLQNLTGIYIGTFKDGYLDGVGECYYSNGAYYKGDFVNGLPNGNGQIIYMDGSNYQGQFVNGEKQGSGLFIYINGDYYNGDFYADMRHGNGVYHWANGDSFSGEFAYSDITENGTFTYHEN